MPETTIDQLAAIEARANAATPGPWANYGNLGHEVFQSTGIEDEEPGIAFDIPKEADANFIAHARTDVPALLALVREQAAKLEAVEALAADLLERGERINEKGNNGSIYATRTEGRGEGYREATRGIRAALTATEGAA